MNVSCMHNLPIHPIIDGYGKEVKYSFVWIIQEQNSQERKPHIEQEKDLCLA